VRRRSRGQNGLRIYPHDSGGANLPTHIDVFPDKEHFGRFLQPGDAPAAGVAQIAVVMGSCTAAALPFPRWRRTIIVREQGMIFLAAAREGRHRRDRHRGGAGGGRTLDLESPITSRRTTTTLIARRIVGNSTVARRRIWIWRSRSCQLRGRGNYGVINADIRKPYDVREVIARVVDDSNLDEFRTHGTTLVTGSRGSGAIWSASSRTTASPFGVRAEGRTSSSCARSANSARVPAEHHGLHGRQEIRVGRHFARREDGDRGVVRPKAEVRR
jgi:hypothetical protein